MATTKLVLDNNEMKERFFEHCLIFGVIAPIKDYKFCSMLNYQLAMDFKINMELEIKKSKNNRNYSYYIYDYIDVAKSIEHYIINNKDQGEPLLPEYKQVDFIWMMKGNLPSENALLQLMETINSLAAVQLTMLLSLDKIKSKENLLF